MTNEYENAGIEENQPLEDGQLEGAVGQDEGVNTQENQESDWQSQAKYFQSEKDKLYAENQQLKKYEQLGNILESRPDVVEAMKHSLSGNGQPNQAEKIVLGDDDFDPWEAYNDPSSKSYKFRMQELQETVNQGVQQQMQGIQEQTQTQQLVGELRNKGLSDDDIGDFFKFAKGNPAEEYGVEGAIKMWRAVTQTPAGDNVNPLESVRQNQSVPQQGGILQGEQPQRKSDKDDMWDSIIKSGSRTNVL